MKNETLEFAPRPYRFTRKEYYAMGDAGVFEGQRVELIGGEIIEMSPQNSPHASRIARLNALFFNAAHTGLVIRPQLPLHLGPQSEPEPDLALVKGSLADFDDKHPVTAELVIEIANASLLRDRIQKGSLYAKARIPDYWLVNLIDMCVEIYRDPVKDRSQPFGFKYSKSLIVKSGDSISPLCLPKLKIAVKEILP